MAERRRIPSYRLSKSTGLAFVELNGYRIYLGKHGTPESRALYNRRVAEWLANGRELSKPGEDFSMLSLCDTYQEFAQGYYVLPSGKPSRMISWINSIVETVLDLYGGVPAAEFGPLALKTVRQKWIDRDLSRKTCNKYVHQLRRMFKWGVSEELIPAPVYQALCAVEGLRRGHCGARESKEVVPVPEADIAAVRPFLSRPVAALVELQLLTAARPGELIELRPCDIDMSGAVWFLRPAEHKTAYRDCKRVIAFGPQAQAVLRPFLLRDREAYLFSPRETLAEKPAPLEKRRREGQKPNAVRTPRRVSDHYTVDSYRRAIARACAKVNAQRVEGEQMQVWHPHQLRHTAATQIRARYGLEAAQVCLGHEHAKTTEIYAERDLGLLVRVMGEVG